MQEWDPTGHFQAANCPNDMYFLLLLPLLVVGAICEGEQQKRSADPGILAGHPGYAGLSSLGTGAVLAGGLAVGGGYPATTGGQLVSQLVEVENKVAVPAPVAVPHAVPFGVPVPVSQPLPIKVPVPVPVVKTLEVPYEKVVPYPVIKRVPIEVVRKIPVPVPDPYPVKVPVYKTKHIYYSLRPKYHHDW